MDQKDLLLQLFFFFFIDKGSQRMFHCSQSMKKYCMLDSGTEYSVIVASTWIDQPIVGTC